mgnify:CR=1 FL=1
MINIRVRSMAEVEGQKFGNAFVISIVSPGAEHPKFEAENQFWCQFNDVREDLMTDSGIMNAMNKELAERLVFIAMEYRDVSTWVIHCEAGISRSPGVAIGLARYLKCTPTAQQLEVTYPHYNRHVADMVAAAARKRICEIVKNVRVQFNND